MAKKLTPEERKRRAAERRLQQFLDGFPPLVGRMLNPQGEDAQRSPNNRVAMLFKLLDKYLMSAEVCAVSSPELVNLVPKCRQALEASDEVDAEELFLLSFELGLEAQRTFDVWARRLDERERERLEALPKNAAEAKRERRDEQVAQLRKLVRRLARENPDWTPVDMAEEIWEAAKEGDPDLKWVLDRVERSKKRDPRTDLPWAIHGIARDIRAILKEAQAKKPSGRSTGRTRKSRR